MLVPLACAEILEAPDLHGNLLTAPRTGIEPIGKPPGNRSATIR